MGGGFLLLRRLGLPGGVLDGKRETLPENGTARRQCQRAERSCVAGEVDSSPYTMDCSELVSSSRCACGCEVG